MDSIVRRERLMATAKKTKKATKKKEFVVTDKKLERNIINVMNTLTCKSKKELVVQASEVM